MRKDLPIPMRPTIPALLPAALLLTALVLSSLGGHASAQSSDPSPASVEPAQRPIPTLEEVRALPPELEVVDLERRNPIKLEPNMFDRSWSPPPTVEEVSLQGGYIFLGINYGLYHAGKALHRLGGGPDQVQPAIARPPPLSEAQLRRAAAYCGEDDCQW